MRWTLGLLLITLPIPAVAQGGKVSFRDDHTNAWQSGMLDGNGRPRPAYEQFTSAIAALSG